MNSKKRGRTPLRWRLYVFFSSVFLLACFGFLIQTGHYLNTRLAGVNSINFYDLFFDFVPKTDVMFLFRVGLLVSLILFCIGTVREWRRAPYILIVSGLWFFVRVFCMRVTLLLPSTESLIPVQNEVAHSLLGIITNSLDSPFVLFFSGHIALTFLGVLLFGKCRIKLIYLLIPLIFVGVMYALTQTPNRIGVLLLFFFFLGFLVFRRYCVPLWIIFFLWTLVMTYTVIATRVHWGIDVVGAYGITAGVMYFVEQSVIGKFLFRPLRNICEIKQ